MPTIRDYRAKLNLTQAELASKAGVARDTINRLERGKTITLRAGTIHKLAKALGVEPGDIEFPRP